MAPLDNIFSDLNESLNKVNQNIENVLHSAPSVIRAEAGQEGEKRETEDALLLRVDMPGLAMENVKISVEHNTLMIKGERDLQGSVHRYIHNIHLQANLYKIDQIILEMKNGVLQVVVPKKK